MSRTSRKHTSRLADFDQEIQATRARLREREADARAVAARPRELLEERRAAVMAVELGKDPGRPVEAIDADLVEAERLARLDEAGAQAQAHRGEILRLQGEREQYGLDHAAELLEEITPEAVEVTDKLLGVLMQAAELLARREAIRQRVSSVVELLPSPNTASTYRVFVPEDRAGRALAAAVHAAMDLAPTLPAEALHPDVDPAEQEITA